MQTHNDGDANYNSFIEQLRNRADKAIANGESKIAGGDEGERALAVWKAKNGFYCRHMPNDSQDIVRISVGGGDHLPTTMNYVGQCIDMLEKAIAALRQCPE